MVGWFWNRTESSITQSRKARRNMQSRAKSQRRKEGAKGNYKAAIPELSAAVKPIGLCAIHHGLVKE